MFLGFPSNAQSGGFLGAPAEFAGPVNVNITLPGGQSAYYSGRYEGDIAIAVPGDSNAVGAGGETNIQANWFRIPVYQMLTNGNIVEVNTQVTPQLTHANTGPTPTGVGPGLAFAQRYAAERGQGRRIVLLPCAVYGSNANSGDWFSGGQWFEAMKSLVQLFMSQNPNNRVAAFIVSLMGNDAGQSQGNLEGYVNSFITGIRTQITGNATQADMSTVPIIWGGLPLNYVPALPGADVVQSVIENIPSNHLHTGYADSRGLSGEMDNNNAEHFTSMAQRESGREKYWAGFVEAEANAPVPGYDVIALAGQSCQIGRYGPIDGGLDATDNRIYQYGFDGEAVSLASDPLDHVDETADTVGPGLSLAKYYADNYLQEGRSVLLVPVAEGGTNFALGYWQPGGTGHDNAVARVNAAMQQGSGTNRLVMISWNQGEGDSGATQTQYEKWLFELIASFRSNMTGADNTTPFVATRIKSTSTGYGAGVDAALTGLTNNVGYTAAVDTNSLTLGPDGLHLTAASSRQLGTLSAQALATAMANEPDFDEPTALRHWLLGDDNPTNQDLISDTPLIDLSTSGPTSALGYITLPAEQPNGLASDISDNDSTAFTVVGVSRRTSGDCVIAGTLSDSSVEGGIASFFNSSTVRINARGGDNQAVGSHGGEFCFVAFSVDTVAGTELCYRGDKSANTVVSPGDQTIVVSNPARDFAIGNAYYAGSLSASIDVAAFILFDSAKSEAELDDIYSRTVQRLANRGVWVK